VQCAKIFGGTVAADLDAEIVIDARAEDAAEVLLTGGLLVKVLGGLVEDDHGKAGQQHPGQGQPLMLAAGQPGCGSRARAPALLPLGKDLRP
jgi:hypothetical protein